MWDQRTTWSQLFHHVYSRDQIEVIRIGGKHLYQSILSSS